MKNVMIGLLIGIVLSFGGVFIYSGLNSEEKLKNNCNEKSEISDEETMKEESLNNNSQLVQMLYNYVKMEPTYLGGVSYINIFDEQNKVMAKDFSDELKNYLGYRLAKNTRRWTECPASLLAESTCGNYYAEDSDGSLAYANAINEKEIKDSVELIFGENSYQEKTFMGCENGGICVYDAGTKKYYETDCRCGGSGWIPTVELRSATKIGEKIEIIEYVKNDLGTEVEEWNLKYTFILSENGNYYFESVEKLN